MRLRHGGFLFSILIGLSLFCASNAFAQANSLPPELKDQINTIISNGVNGITVFSSQPTVSSGNFKIRNDEDPDSHFEVFRIPVSVDLTKGDTFTPYVDANLGFFKLVETFVPVEGSGENDFSSIETFSAGVGGGVKIDAAEWFRLTPAFNAYYSRTENHYDYNNQFSQEVLEPYGKQLFGWEVETMTYVPSIRADAKFALGAPLLTLWSKYSHLFNDSFSTNSSTIDISSDTGLWQNSVGLQIPIGVEVSSCPLSVKTTFTRTDIYGSGREGLELDYFYEAGIDLIADTRQTMATLQNLSVGGSYSFGDDFSGWRVGVGYEF